MRNLRRFPGWLTRRIPTGKAAARIGELLKKFDLHTVCRSARCPNLHDCFSRGTATFLILGNICTRGCSFCGVRRGEPLPVDKNEPERVALAVRELGLKYVLITSVTRDDLRDGGASQFVEVVRQLRTLVRGVAVEILIPDFKGSKEALYRVIQARPDVIGHNVETVPRLYNRSRAGADYRRSLVLLETIKSHVWSIITKSGLMLGMGETSDEVLDVMKALRKVGCDILTLGQYLKPSRQNLDVHEFVHPEKFEEYSRVAQGLGFSYVASGPFVRSSYHAQAALTSVAGPEVALKQL